MGAYDTLYCKYPLPVPGMNDRSFETKDTPGQWLDTFEIREDGTLWHQEYDVLWHLGRRVNERWVQVPRITGEIIFYDIIQPDGWIEFSAYFCDGKIEKINLLQHKEPTK